MPYMPAIGALCTARRLVGKWRVVNHIHDGLVTKCVLKCIETGELTTRFNYEITEMSSSSYADVNQYLQEVGGMNVEDFDDIFNESFNIENVPDNTEHVLQDLNVNVCTEQVVSSSSSTAETTSISDTTASQPSKRFKSASVEDVNKLKSQNTEKSTDRQTKWATKLLKDWMLEVGYQTTDFESLPVAELDEMFQKFYAAVRTKDGKDYSKSALIGLRAAINRHLTSPPFSRNINLMNDRDFMASNQVLSGLVKTLKREGKDISKHKDPICPEDLAKLYESGVFSDNTAPTLQNKVMYDIISQFGRRGQEGLRSLRKDSFLTNVDARGRRYVCMAYNEADKNHHGLNSRESNKNPRMYENGGKFCPVRSFEKYVSKLNPNLSDFFQRPLEKVTEEKKIWYANKSIGVNTLSSFMARLSDEANLSQRYTNHCIRAHISSTLHEQGFSSRAIMSVTGHRNVASLASYVKPSDDERERLSRALCPRSPGCINSQRNNNIHVQAEHQSFSTPPALNNSSSASARDIDVSVQENRALHMFTGNISHSTITMNVYHAK